MIPTYDVFEDIAAALVVFAVTFYSVEAINDKPDNIVKHICIQWTRIKLLKRFTTIP